MTEVYFIRYSKTLQTFVIYFVSFAILKLTFYRWLKIKHDIKY